MRKIGLLLDTKKDISDITWINYPDDVDGSPLSGQDILHSYYLTVRIGYNFITKPASDVYYINPELLRKQHVLLRYRLLGSYVHSKEFNTVSDASIFAIKHINCYGRYREIYPIEILYNWESVWVKCEDKCINNASLIELIGKFD